jgi:transposase
MRLASLGRSLAQGGEHAKQPASPDHVVQILKEAEATPLAEVCRRHGISAPMFYRWKAKYGVTTPVG